MIHTSIPTSYFPSTALFLDDNHEFLLNFVLQLDEGLAYRIFESPRKALDYIHQKTNELDLLKQQSLKEFHEKQPMGSSLPQLTGLQSTVYNPHRFSEISVVIVDYAMPGMDGLEFCRQIDNPYIKKILLTGQADEKLAIEAFNEGLIHRYVKKSDVNAAQLITKNIYELQQAYFQSISDKIVRERGLLVPSCSQDKTFNKFFREICTSHDLIEYYMLDSTGSFLMLDEDANMSMLLVRREDDLYKHAEWAAENSEIQEIVDSLSRGELIPVKNNSLTPHKEASSISLMPAHRLSADQSYYYAYIQDKKFFNSKHKKILSYHRYLEELDAEELFT